MGRGSRSLAAASGDAGRGEEGLRVVVLCGSVIFLAGGKPWHARGPA
jgi:hypothetical protein